MPNFATAQQEECGYFYECEGGEHKITGATQSNLYPHAGCGVCLYGACHPVCDNSFAANSAIRAKFSAVIAAANAGDISAVLRLAPELPGYVAYNPDRQAIQIRACTPDAIIASLTVRRPADLLLAMALPSPSQVFARSVLATVGHGLPGSASVRR